MHLDKQSSYNLNTKTRFNYIGKGVNITVAKWCWLNPVVTYKTCANNQLLSDSQPVNTN